MNLSGWRVAQCNGCGAFHFYPDDSQGCGKCGASKYEQHLVQNTKANVIEAYELELELKERQVMHIKVQIEHIRRED